MRKKHRNTKKVWRRRWWINMERIWGKPTNHDVEKIKQAVSCCANDFATILENHITARSNAMELDLSTLTISLSVHSVLNWFSFDSSAITFFGCFMLVLSQAGTCIVTSNDKYRDLLANCGKYDLKRQTLLYENCNRISKHTTASGIGY